MEPHRASQSLMVMRISLNSRMAASLLISPPPMRMTSRVSSFGYRGTSVSSCAIDAELLRSQLDRLHGEAEITRSKGEFPSILIALSVSEAKHANFCCQRSLFLSFFNSRALVRG